MPGFQDFLNKSNLEKLLKEPISKVDNKEGSKSGDNLAGQLHSVEVLTESGKRVNLIYKAAPPVTSPIQRSYVLIHKIFKVEIQTYTTLRERIENLVSSRTGTKIEFPYATYYGGQADEEDDFICLEDCRPDGYRMPDKFKGLNYPQMELALTELAKFHAYTYFLIKFEGESFFEREDMEEIRAGSLWLRPTNIYTNFGPAFKVALKFLEERKPEVAARLRAVMPSEDSDIYQLGTSVFRKTDTDYFPVLCHGDFWLNNLLFKYENEDETKPIGIKLIDFQMTNRGNIFQELQYFIFTSTTPQFRSQHLTQALNLYYEVFTDTLSSIQCPQPPNFTSSYFIDQFMQTYFPALGFILFAIPLQLGRSVEAKTDAAEDEVLDPVGSMCRSLRAQLEVSPEAVQRMEDVLQEFMDLKLL